MTEASGYPGVTEPLALVPPTQRDLALTDELVKTLTSCGAYESNERTKQR